MELKVTGCEGARCMEASQNPVKLKDSVDSTSTTETSCAAASVMASWLVGCLNRHSPF